MQNKVLGVFEKIDFPQFGISKIKAKVDSGAFNGALHCTKIFVEKEGRETVLHFSPFDFPSVKISTEDFEEVEVKSSNGHMEKRYLIKTFITIQKETYPIYLTLADRTTMDWPVLIGRRFLQKHNFLLDVNKGFKLPLAKEKFFKK